MECAVQQMGGISLIAETQPVFMAPSPQIDSNTNSTGTSATCSDPRTSLDWLSIAGRAKVTPNMARKSAVPEIGQQMTISLFSNTAFRDPHPLSVALSDIHLSSVSAKPG